MEEVEHPPPKPGAERFQALRRRGSGTHGRLELTPKPPERPRSPHPGVGDPSQEAQGEDQQVGQRRDPVRKRPSSQPREEHGQGAQQVPGTRPRMREDGLRRRQGRRLEDQGLVALQPEEVPADLLRRMEPHGDHPRPGPHGTVHRERSPLSNPSANNTAPPPTTSMGAA